MSTAEYDSAEADALLDAVGPAFSQLRRSVLLEVPNPPSAKEMSRSLVLVRVQEGTVEPGAEITVGMVAEQLTVDPSVGSRMVSDCISAGYLARAASQQDGRRTVLRLSKAGEAMLAQFRKHQRDAYEHITADWSEQDRLDLARLLIKYVHAGSELRRRETGE